MKQCPVCTKELEKIENISSTEDYFGCRKTHTEDVGFSICYRHNSDEITYFNLLIDKYYIENNFRSGRTSILIKSEVDVGFRPFLFLPLVHFELCDLEGVKKKLKLLVMMY